MTGFRTERLGQAIQEKIGSLILEGKIKDNRVNTFLSITNVKVSRDLSYADVYVSDIRGKTTEKEIEGLKSAAGFIQSQLNAVMHIKKTPRLRFHADSSVGDGFALIKKIESLSESEINSRRGAEIAKNAEED